MSRLRIAVTDRDHVRGPAAASVTLVEYGDFQCPFCGEAYYVLRELEQRFRRELRLVFRHFPITQAHPLAFAAAEASEAAGAQGRFWEMHDLLFENQPRFESRSLIAYATQLDLDIDGFADDINTHRHAERIRADFMGGVRSGVNGTPGLFINGELFDGPADLEPLARAIDEARQGRIAAYR
jgi:protein-disulfide isomerase